MAKIGMLAKVGSWAFIIGVIIALIVGVFSAGQGNALTTSLLIVLGLIVGFLNVTGRESKDFLLTAAVLVIVAGFGGNVLGGVQMVGPYLAGIMAALITFVIPATVIVALRAIYAIAHDE